MSPWSQALQFLLSGLVNGSVYAIVALGFTIIYNATGIVNFAQGEFVMVGALLMVTLTAAGLPTLAALPIAMLGAVAVGVLLERLAIRPVRSGSIVTLVIITVGASTLLRGAGLLIWGRDYLPLAPFSDREPFYLGDAALLPQGAWVLGITVGLVVLLHFFYGRTRIGKAIRACAINRRAASLVGIGVDRMVMLSFGLSAALGALAGIIIAPLSGASFEMGTMLGLKGFCAAIVGGLGSGFGGIVGGLALGILESLGAGYGPSEYKDAIAFLLLLVILFFRPAGLLGRVRTGGL